MEKLTLIVLTSLMLTGCGVFKTRIVTDTKEVLIPVVSCPKPPDVERPELPIHTITPELKASDGEVVKHYKATVLSLMDYSEDLEKIVDHYTGVNKMTEDVRAEIEKAIAAKKAEIDKLAPPSQ
jgi:hypothetical protein